MKKILSLGISALVAIAFTSCEKSYTCTCTYPGAAVGTTETTFKAKKDDAQAQCNNLNTSAQVTGGACALK
jgi:hypothetical protein